MFPSILARQLREALVGYVAHTFAPSTKGFEGIVERFASEEDNIVKGPFVSLQMPFRRGTVPSDYFPSIQLDFSPYLHQQKAFERLAGASPSSTIIATGTGSGKTECFTWPILNHCLRHKDEPGIKAILIYPMNALAANQGQRLARAIFGNRSLNGVVRVGMYADREPKQPTSFMSSDSVILCRETMVQNPPDILITNYKMLDYLLIRPGDKNIWSQNLSSTLKYLVIDELHTYDGAAGTDLACLLRRLKSRLAIPDGHLCCVGASATLGAGSEGDIAAYAEKVFGEPFIGESVVTEQRLDISDYLLDRDVYNTIIPKPYELDALLAEFPNYAEQDLICKSYCLLFGAKPDVTQISSSDWRIKLGRELDGHMLMHSLLRIGRGAPVSFSEIVGELSDRPYLQIYTPSQIISLLDALFTLVAHAKRESSGAPSEHLQPYFSLRIQLWLREMKRMVADLPSSDMNGNKLSSFSLRFSDDLAEAQIHRHLPVIHCRECGTYGWATANPLTGHRLVANLKDIYDQFFERKMRLRLVFLEKPTNYSPKKGEQLTEEVLICTDCLTYRAKQKHFDSCCAHCGSNNFLVAYLHHSMEIREQIPRASRNCPFCGRLNGLGILGAQSATLLGASISTLFASKHNSDPKVLAFSDSVQDAAHRAGFIEARSFSSVLRTSIVKCLHEQDGHAKLPELTRNVSSPGRYSRPEDFVATFTPQDLQWLSGYRGMLEHDSLQPEDALPQMLESRIAWEAFAELTFRSQDGVALEKRGSLAAVYKSQKIRDASATICQLARDKLGDGFAQFSPVDWYRFLSGAIDHMRIRGAVFTELTDKYVQAKAIWYEFRKLTSIGNVWILPSARGPRPAFPTDIRLRDFDSLGYASQGTNWYAQWAAKHFQHKNPMLMSSISDLYREAFHALTKAQVLEARAISQSSNSGHIWGLPSNSIGVTAETAMLRCSACKQSRFVGDQASSDWIDMPCTRHGCTGQYALAPTGAQLHKGLNVTSPSIRRTIAREHTGILPRDVRRHIEDRFMRDRQESWDPNFLSATSTLEMGIDIGDLSTVALCSVPPDQSNYIQRIGRSGRRNGNALNLTIASGRAHDLYYWAQPKDMIAGSIKVPGVHLNAYAILKRQFAAYSLDCLNRDKEFENGYGKLRACFAAIESNDEARFPPAWIKYVSDRDSELADAFALMFPQVVEQSPDTFEDLKSFARSDDDSGGFATWISSEFQQEMRELKRIKERIKALDNDRRALRKETLPEDKRKESLAELDAQKEQLRKLRRSIEDKDVLAFLTERGMLPNYAFPEEGIRLQSSIYYGGNLDDGKPDAKVYEYVRPASVGLSELAPPAYFYAEGHRARVDEISLFDSGAELWRLCPVCSFMVMEAQTEEGTNCPRCNSSRWLDKAQLLNLIRLRQVGAAASARKSGIGDYRDERQITGFTRKLLPSFRSAQVSESFKLEKSALPFGFEFIPQCDFIDINFGQPKESDGGVLIAENKLGASGFDICRGCGVVQGIHSTEEEKDHRPWCRHKDGKNILEGAYLYRRLQSEAIRILMPIGSLDAEEHAHSFVAGIKLGLKLHFQGKVDHLNTTSAEVRQNSVSRRYLYIYDTVPGGTGYLKQLFANRNDFRAVFQKALDHMCACSCNSEKDPASDMPKDGCYRCVFAYRDSAHMQKISRNKAAGVFEDILAHWDSCKKIRSIDHIEENALLESELEAMFVGCLRDWAAQGGGKFRPVAVRGKKGYQFRASKDAPSWMVEPQVWLDERFGLSHRCRADFVLAPVRSEALLKPIVIFCDGWKYHQERIKTDLAQRLAAKRTGKCFVWSLTYSDLHGLRKGTSATADHLDPLLTGRDFANLGEFLGPETCGLAEKAVGENPAKNLLRYLSAENSSAWDNVGTALALAAFLANNSCKEANSIAQHLQGMGCGAAMGYLKNGESDLVAMLSSGNMALLGAMPLEQRSKDRAKPVVIIDDSNLNSPELQKSWNTALHFLNLIQFSNWAHACCATNPDISTPDGQEALDTAAAPEDVSSEEYVLEDLRPLLEQVKKNDAPAPAVGYELLEGNTIVAMAELAWEDRKLAIAEPDQLAAFERCGWGAIAVSEAAANPKAVLAQLAS